MSLIAIIDYGAGNLKSVNHALKGLGLETDITSNPERLYSADALILPGVGAFRDAMIELERLNLVEAIKENAGSGKPILGICLGMQLFYEKSYEHGQWEGLGLLEGEVVRFNHDFKVPHMGWNQLKKGTDSEFTEKLTENEYVYFVHSYYVVPKHPEEVVFWTDYGVKFPAMVQKGNLIGMQFHPEKSAETGITLLQAFGAMIK
jgi:glutamine amidotransferase